MPSMTYQQTTEKDIEDRLRKRFRAEMELLKKMGFEEFCICEELSFPYGLLLYLVILPLMLIQRQVFKIKGSLRVALYDPVLISREYATYATLSGLGVTFHTNFAERTLLVSRHSQLKLPDLTNDKVKYYHQPKASIESAWQFHQAKLNELKLGGKQLQESSSFEDYLETSKRGDAIVGQAILTGKIYERRKESRKPNKLFSVFMLCVLVAITIGLALMVPKLYHLLEMNPYRGMGIILAIFVMFLNFLMVTWDAFRGRAFDFTDIFYIPETAVWIRRIGYLLLGLFVASLVLDHFFNVLPKYSSFTVAQIWFLYENCASLFYRLGRLLTRSRLLHQ